MGLSKRIRVVRPERRISRGYGWVRDGCGPGQLHLRALLSRCPVRSDLRAPHVGGAFLFSLSYKGWRSHPPQGRQAVHMPYMPHMRVQGSALQCMPIWSMRLKGTRSTLPSPTLAGHGHPTQGIPLPKKYALSFHESDVVPKNSGGAETTWTGNPYFLWTSSGRSIPSQRESSFERVEMTTPA